MSVHTRIRTALGLVAVGALTIGLAACSGGGTDGGSGGDGGSEELTTVGFVAVGPEGAWREANEQNIQDTFTEDAGYELKYAPATNLDQKSQIDAFTSFVDEGVDVILLSATEASGWEDSLTRAQEAEIPVILLDRGIEPDDDSLYVTRIAPDNVEVAKQVGAWAASTFPDGGKYVVLEGPAGVGVVNERNTGFDEGLGDAALTKLDAQTANWSAEEGKSVFETMLKANNNDIQLVFAQNDEMGLGAAQAAEEAGLVVGEDVKIATIDGTKNAMQALADGQLSYVHEYNPLFGETALEVVEKALEGEEVESYIVVPSEEFDSAEAAKAVLADRKY
ncbi:MULTISPECIES: substrate-binding domain-containing protein [unclassified Microbacterium]|uniref:substrate-binding domain-containing protein n=1 Tax=unclassified Microbacterium TaxID=2609290 RepID=UPI000EA9E038|nr:MULTISPECIES: substrate-binding domain-containing protein [unclassified Microbacterium]MBT2483658.1 substrate-binding domain-containing protein [Microbacterium sp. ISL-108]RKN66660.1 sugar ABC transporter substrate-binding protein [Microbacterium sp. CGR2]